MAKKSGDENLLFFIVMIIFVAFLGDQLMNEDNYNVSTTHKILYEYGISQKIEGVENALRK
jgi:hypothetical protein|nr:MAG TPA: hypothetical protein [Caudoviricetes sp.]